MSHCPKFKFGENDTIDRWDGTGPIPADEPVFLIRGKDQVGLLAVKRYIEIMRQFPDSELAKEHADSSQKQLNVMIAWQQANPDKVGMGCHSCPDPNCREKLDLDLHGLLEPVGVF